MRLKAAFPAPLAPARPVTARLASVLLATGLLACLPLAGCGGPAADAPQDFRPLAFGYLTPLRLNVGAVSVQDNAATGAPPGDLSADAPEPPDQALTAMANQRLIAAGDRATAVFTIDQASITADGDTLNGVMMVHLDIIGANGAHLGVAQAQVSRQFSGTGRSKAVLYDLTRQMMTDMNVEFEFQVRRSLKDWLLTASGTPVLGAITTQALPPPAGAIAAPVAAGPVTGGTGTGTGIGTGGPVQLAPPAPAGQMPAAPVSGGTVAGTTSPPPGFLTAPPGATAIPAIPTGVLPPSTFDDPSNLPQPGAATANPAPNQQPWGY